MILNLSLFSNTQIKKSGGSNTLAENAEGLLLRSKPFTELTNHLSLAVRHQLTNCFLVTLWLLN